MQVSTLDLKRASFPVLIVGFGFWFWFSLQMNGILERRGERQEHGVLFGNHVLVCIKVVSPRGSSQEYSHGVLGTLHTRAPTGAEAWTGRSATCQRLRTSRECGARSVCGLSWLVTTHNCKGVLAQLQLGISLPVTTCMLLASGVRVAWEDTWEMTVSVTLVTTCSYWCRLRKLGCV